MIDYDNNRTETMMKQWDSWVAYYIGGGKGSWPRDAFEAMIDYYEDRIMETEIINKLFLELSQVATAKTEREIELEAIINEAIDQDPINYKEFLKSRMAKYWG